MYTLNVCFMYGNERELQSKRVHIQKFKDTGGPVRLV